MGRFSASGARLHELRQPKPAKAAFRQSRPPRSRGSSLGPEHPQSVIRPACREGPALDVDVIEPPPVPPAQRWLDPPRRPRGALPASSPWDPTGRMPAQAPRGCCPGRAAARRTRDIGSSPAIRWGCRPSRTFANPALRAASRTYRPTSRARRPCIGDQSGNPGKSPQRCKAPRRLCRGSRTRVDRSQQVCRTPAAALV